MGAIGLLALTGEWTRLARFCVTWFVVTAGSSLVAPSYYPNYNAFLAPSAALAAAVGVERLQFVLKRHRTHLMRWTAALAVIAASVSGAVLVKALLGGAQLSFEHANASEVALTQRVDGCLLSFDPGQLISRGSLPDPRCLGALAVDPYGAQLLAVVKSGRPYSSAREAFTDPASERTVVHALDRSGGVILGDRGQIQLADARRRLEDQFERNTTLGPGVDLWIRKRDRIKPVGRRRRRTGRTEVCGFPPADAVGVRSSDPTS